MRMRTLVWLIIVAFGCTAAQAQKKNDTFSVFFDLNVAELNVGARNTIDSLFYVEKLKNGVGISIIGYADYLATDEYNLELSRNRAEHVRDYLVQSGIRANLIKLLLGKGEVRRRDTLRSERGVAEDRRVDIVMEYVKPRQDVVRTDMSITVKQSGDTDIVMRPSEKLIIPPSSDDPGFDIDQVPAGKTFILKNIYFPMGRHFPRETSYDELNMLLQAIQGWLYRWRVMSAALPMTFLMRWILIQGRWTFRLTERGLFMSGLRRGVLLRTG